MKRTNVLVYITVILLLAATLTGCANSAAQSQDLAPTYYNKNWEDPVGTYNGDVIPNEECAIAVATEIYRHMEHAEENYVPIDVFYDEVDQIWIVTFFEENNTTTAGGDCSIAIQKKDGRVLRIWFGE